MRERVLLLCHFEKSVMQKLVADPRVLFVESTTNRLHGFHFPLARSVVGIVVRSGIEVNVDLLDSFPQLRFVIRAGSGLDNIDRDELKARGVQLLHNQELSAPAVAELVHACLILLARRVPESSALLHQGIWAKTNLIGESIAELSVAIWGAGPVGRECAHVIKPICAELVFAAWPSVPKEYPQVAPKELMRVIDAHIICLPLRSTTVGMFDKEFFKCVSSKRPYILNAARFAMMNFMEAVVALEEKKLRGLFIDPIERTDIDNVRQIVGQKKGLNILLSQHLGAQRADVLEKMGAWVIQKIDEVMPFGSLDLL
jgi:D-3-phosphoglycerate dehydrogenase